MKTTKLGIAAAIALAMAIPSMANASNTATTKIDAAHSAKLISFTGLTFGTGVGATADAKPLFTDIHGVVTDELGNQGNITALYKGIGTGATVAHAVTGVTNTYFEVTAGVPKFTGNWNAVSATVIGHQLIDETTGQLINTVHTTGTQYVFNNLKAGDVYDWQVSYSTHVAGATLSSTINVAAVPEPEEWAMLLLGLPLIGWMVHRKQVIE